MAFCPLLTAKIDDNRMMTIRGQNKFKTDVVYADRLPVLKCVTKIWIGKNND